MKIAFVSSQDPRDIHSWSGLAYYIPNSLRAAGLSLDLIGPIEPAVPLRVWVRRVAYKAFARTKYLYGRDPDVGKRYASEVDRRISSLAADLVFSIGGHPIAYLETETPVVSWADATFKAMVDFYPGFSNLSRRSERDGNAMEAGALRRASLALFASDWAASSAVNDYGVDPAKVHVVPFGANIDLTLTEEEVAQAISSRSREICRLLFVGVDWPRKGGPVAVDVADHLNKEGVPTELTIVGCDPQLSNSALKFTRVHPMIDKADPKGRAKLADLFARSHFLILPSRAECFGVVLCEANAYGVPCLTTNVGGIPTVIRQGVNGRMFDVTASPPEWAAYAAALVSNVRAYRELAHSAYGEYRRRLNWNVSAATVKDLLTDSERLQVTAARLRG